MTRKLTDRPKVGNSRLRRGGASPDRTPPTVNTNDQVIVNGTEDDRSGSNAPYEIQSEGRRRRSTNSSISDARSSQLGQPQTHPRLSRADLRPLVENPSIRLPRTSSRGSDRPSAQTPLAPPPRRRPQKMPAAGDFRDEYVMDARRREKKAELRARRREQQWEQEQLTLQQSLPHMDLNAMLGWASNIDLNSQTQTSHMSMQAWTVARQRAANLRPQFAQPGTPNTSSPQVVGSQLRASFPTGVHYPDSVITDVGTNTAQSVAFDDALFAPSLNPLFSRHEPSGIPQYQNVIPAHPCPTGPPWSLPGTMWPDQVEALNIRFQNMDIDLPTTSEDVPPLPDFEFDLSFDSPLPF